MGFGRTSSFVGGGGFLRDKDSQIVGLKFTTDNPFPTPAKFDALYGIVSFLEDGKEAPISQPFFVGGAEDFGIMEHGRGLVSKGRGMSKKSGWYLLYASLVTPTGGGKGFDEALIPESDEQADYSAIIGARVRTDFQKNEEVTKKYGKKKSKSKDGKVREYDREDLIVTAYYGQFPVAGAPQVQQTAAVTPNAVTAAAIANILDVLDSAVGKQLELRKLNIKLLTSMSEEPAELRDAVAAWARVEKNLASIPGAEYNAGTKTIRLAGVLA